MYIFVGILFFNFSLFQIDFKMIRSYRTKRRKIQEELKTLHFSKKLNETSNNFNVHTASTSEELNISANIQKKPKASNNDKVLISTFRQTWNKIMKFQITIVIIPIVPTVIQM